MLARVSIVKRKMRLTSYPGKHIVWLVKRKKNPHAVALAKLGAQKGGRARAASLTPEERKEIARRAAQARWGKKGRETA